MRQEKAKNSSWRKEIFRLNVFNEEFNKDPGFEFVFEDDADKDGKQVRYLKNTIKSLNGALQQSQMALQSAQTDLFQQQHDCSSLTQRNADLEGRNLNLINRLSAVETEASENAQQNLQLQARLNEVLVEKENQRGTRIYGKKNMCELGHSQVTATKAAFRDEFRESIDTFGRNRGLQMQSITLLDSNGDQVVVNAQRPHTYDNLSAAERKRVAFVSQWKDLNRVSDRVYSSIAKSACLPPASHIKRYEFELNDAMPTIHEVSGLKISSLYKVFHGNCLKKQGRLIM